MPEELQVIPSTARECLELPVAIQRGRYYNYKISHITLLKLTLNE